MFRIFLRKLHICRGDTTTTCTHQNHRCSTIWLSGHCRSFSEWLPAFLSKQPPKPKCNEFYGLRQSKCKFCFFIAAKGEDFIHFCQFCNFLAEEGYPIPKAVLRVKKLDVPKRLPRPLPGNDVFVLEKCIIEALSGKQKWHRDVRAIHDLAWLYLLWHCGFCELTLQDLNLENGKIFLSNSRLPSNEYSH